jgi:hypothetical protein
MPKNISVINELEEKESPAKFKVHQEPKSVT